MSSTHDKLISITRRRALSALGATLAFSAGSGCFDRPREKILPYSKKSPQIPGVPEVYATSMVLDGFATGVLVESRDGRPTKIEGNPDHPASLGATRAFEQASILDLYDPSRAKAVLHRGQPSSWERFAAAMKQNLVTGRVVRILMPPEGSPLLGSLLDELAETHDLRVCFHAAVDRRGRREATTAVFGREVELAYDFSRARAVLALDADFTCTMPNAIRWARDFAASRRPSLQADAMCRFHSAEPFPSPTGTLADERLSCRASDVAAVAAAVLAELIRLGAAPEAAPFADLVATLSAPEHDRFARVAAADLLAAGKRAIVIAGDQQPAATHVLACLLNAALGSLGEVVTPLPPALLRPAFEQSLGELLAELEAGVVDTLFVLDGDPIATVSAEARLATLLGRVPMSVRLGSYLDETAAACRWFLPQSHYLEAWGDARSYDGTVSFVQPLIAPLYETRSPAEVLGIVANRARPDSYQLLRERWRGEWGDSFERQWASCVQRGLDPSTAARPLQMRPDWRRAAELLAGAPRPPGGVELRFPPSPCIYDGRFSRNAWLLELPHPTTKQTWGNAAILGPVLAAELGVDDGDWLELTSGVGSVIAPAIIEALQAAATITLDLGYGVELGGEMIGAPARALRSLASSYVTEAISVRKVEGRTELARTQRHMTPEGRPIALALTLEAYRRHPDFAAEYRGPVPSLLPKETEQRGPQWAMTIDMTICTGCSACVVACQAENNIPTVGPEGVRRGREMHWLRIDRYLVGASESPMVVNQPMMCQHCEKAPCEYVCPVNATVHSPDGLNEMVYNRCIGTRFCSNNCPYKVRRFNWFDTVSVTPTNLQANPDVTVRERGVMEKCTYCVQRIRRAEKAAMKDRRTIAPGEVVTACQQACPTGAISFGSLDDPGPELAEKRAEPRRYGVLHDLGTAPRTQYLAKVVNRGGGGGR